MTIGFIGAGTMASAIIAGVVERGIVSPEDVVVFDPQGAASAALAATLGVRVAESNELLIDAVDTVVLAIKPQVFGEVLPPLATALAENGTLVVSIAAGTSLARIEELLGEHGAAQPVVRVMPNVNAQIGAGMAAVAGNASASAAQVAEVVELFRAVGDAIELPEASFSTFTAIAGSAPAYAFLFIDSLARGALKAGMPKALATRIAAQTVLGSARMILESEDHPWTLIDKVCSPGGTTIAGLMALEDGGFTSTVVDSVSATIERDLELGAGR
ncbi:pyrroline-5-carboxylate reductase [Sanguibacter sp. A247]|uniref:pyrroline-5-carboxylate reductase n=1 Tax=unclassified Sanguibacter TaxID=2645534 RepID=UPI003FD7841B